ncbi:protein EMBRYONIC FLOWER 1 [Prunus yedoensis var. nudiflora]|uniref:Protein EMBRYONIC FLOWER 1 n=1 Tax=Prunus yedoensis var. nudiflora TaxID=2094558 RepID=A0A314UBY9_PRUYE|nr:protein EMBRYONIC FLOWER 1 [Prunus yedoensis var. nudiflora]
MERGLLMADNHKRSDPIIASKSKSLGSFVKIDSISIDLADANVKSSSSHGQSVSTSPYAVMYLKFAKRTGRKLVLRAFPKIMIVSKVHSQKLLREKELKLLLLLLGVATSNILHHVLLIRKKGRMKFTHYHHSNENALEDSVSHEMPRLNSVQTEVNPKRTQERHKDDTEALRLEGNGSVKACKPGCESHEDTNVELDITNKNFWNKNGIQTSEAKYQTSAEDNHKESMNAFGTYECDYASSENFDKSSGLSRKKSRKVRLLSELVNKGDAKTDCIRIEDSPSNTISNISGAGIVSQGQVSVQENARVGLSDNKRRKFPEEEEQGCLETSHPKSLNKKLKAFRRDEETTNAIAESVLEEDAVARPSLQADEKSNWNRHENERIPAVGRGIDQIPFPASEAEGKSGICKRKGKMPKVDNGQASLFPWNGMFRTSPKTREDVEIMHTGHPFHLAEDASAEKGLDLSLNSYLAAERCGKKSIPQSEDGFPSLSTWKDGSCKLDVFMRKNVEANYAANLKPSKSILNAFSGKGGHGELSSKFYTIPCLS